jgi:hypothetical protein
MKYYVVRGTERNGNRVSITQSILKLKQAKAVKERLEYENSIATPANIYFTDIKVELSQMH